MPILKKAYTESELKKALLNLLNNNSEYIQSAGMPRACTGAAEKCFIEQTPENSDTALLRQALKDLHTTGQFNYK